MKSRFPRNMALHWHSRVLFELLRCWCQASWPVYPLLRMCQRALEDKFTLPVAISQSITRRTPTLPSSIYSCDDESACSIHLIEHVVLAIKKPHGLIWPMIGTMQKWFNIVNLFIQGRSVPWSCSTIGGGLCIIAIMISHVWVQTSVNHQFYYIYFYYDILTKVRLK